GRGADRSRRDATGNRCRANVVLTARYAAADEPAAVGTTGSAVGSVRLSYRPRVFEQHRTPRAHSALANRVTQTAAATLSLHGMSIFPQRQWRCRLIVLNGREIRRIGHRQTRAYCPARGGELPARRPTTGTADSRGA